MMWRPTVEPASTVEQDLLNASSLGTTAAQRLRQKTPSGQARLTRAIAWLGEAVFLSYRLNDLAAATLATQLEEKLRHSLGPDRVFDIAWHMTSGTTIAGSLHGALRRCATIVVIVGETRQWDLLRNPTDWMHIEITHALRLGIPVLPVLLGEVPMAQFEQLPAALAPLTHGQYLRYADDVSSLIAAVTRLVHPQPEPDPTDIHEHGNVRRVAMANTAAAGRGGAVQRTVSTAAIGTTTTEKGRRIVGVERQTLAKDLVKRYTSGESIRALAASTGRSYGFVHRVLTEAGVQLRQHRVRRRKNA